MIGISLVLFPKLALGLSGFETGVAVMPLIQGPGLQERIRNTQQAAVHGGGDHERLPDCDQRRNHVADPGRRVSGRRLRERARAVLPRAPVSGKRVRSLYDISTILILAFAGASAMAGLLNLMPRYLPRFGMAPEWARASRPLVLVYIAVAFGVTILFRANVDAQGGAYATGVLVLMTSGACAVAGVRLAQAAALAVSARSRWCSSIRRC